SLLVPPPSARSAIPIPAQGRTSPPLSGRTNGVLTAFAAVMVWAVHDRLAEPLFSIAAWNHSLAFFFYLASLLCLVRTMRSGGRVWWLASLLFLLVALFTYEVAVSVLPAGALLLLLRPRSATTDSVRRRSVAFALALAALVWGAVQLVIRLAPGMTSYYKLAP